MQTLILLIRHYEAYKIYTTNMDISHEISALEGLAQNKALPENLRPEIRSQIRSIEGSTCKNLIVNAFLYYSGVCVYSD